MRAAAGGRAGGAGGAGGDGDRCQRARRHLGRPPPRPPAACCWAARRGGFCAPISAPLSLSCQSQAAVNGLPLCRAVTDTTLDLRRGGQGSLYRYYCLCWSMTCACRTGCVQPAAGAAGRRAGLGVLGGAGGCVPGPGAFHGLSQGSPPGFPPPAPSAPDCALSAAGASGPAPVALAAVVPYPLDVRLQRARRRQQAWV